MFKHLYAEWFIQAGELQITLFCHLICLELILFVLKFACFSTTYYQQTINQCNIMILACLSYRGCFQQTISN